MDGLIENFGTPAASSEGDSMKTRNLILAAATLLMAAGCATTPPSPPPTQCEARRVEQARPELMACNIPQHFFRQEPYLERREKI